ncbi:MarR family winged helix-turn-helix transcriptional regulator [Erysipelotrichaceae bacterium OttesenSCG-928-M19]|nr:MarR family winged helix-turn-helix transcriptional regulator [Erysipelotrichaceae bacterium OttesenSCG-928-M19]
MTRNKTACYCINMRCATTALTMKYDDTLAEYDLTINQFSIIKNIDHLTNATADKLTQVIGIERTTLLRNIKPLLNKGFIEVKKQQKKKLYSKV